MRGIVIIFIAIIVIFVIYVFAFDNELVVRLYKIPTDKVQSGIRIGFIADLHNSEYGENQKDLMDRLTELHPDIVLLGGDIIDENSSIKNTAAFIASVAKAYPCFYVSGNNEVSSGQIQAIKRICADTGVVFLEGDCYNIDINGQDINICGIDDCLIGEREFNYQLETTMIDCDTNLYTVLLSHRPEHIDKYLNFEYDLILSGHTHGGIWRLPFIINGLYAQNQGLFPKYAGGIYEFDKAVLIVSRGLEKDTNYFPRIFNPPELVIVDIVSE